MQQLPQPQTSSFTLEIQGRARELITPCKISHPQDLNQGELSPQLQLHDTTALWDTGATGCVVTPELVNAVGLKPTGSVQVQGVGGSATRQKYLLNLYLPNRVVLTVPATDCKISGGKFGVIIGMDVIGAGDMAVSCSDGTTRFSFRIPSISKIDFIKEDEERQANRPVRNDVQIGRNEKVIIHKPGKNDIAKLKKKHAEEMMKDDEEWEMVGPLDRQ